MKHTWFSHQKKPLNSRIITWNQVKGERPKLKSKCEQPEAKQN